MKLFEWIKEETELHQYIIDAFRNIGYDCVNLHGSGASVEGGIDIYSNKLKDTVGIAVKRSPKKKDISQLDKLISNDVNRRLYIFVNDPTKPFLVSLNKYRTKGLIEVMDADALHKFLVNNKSISYVEQYLYNTDLFENLITIMDIWRSARQAKAIKPAKNDLDDLWVWKDRAVSFHKTANTVYDIMESKIKSEISDAHYENLIQEIVNCLSYINHEVDYLREFYEKIRRENPGFLSHMWSVCKSRSNLFKLLVSLENNETQKTKYVFLKLFSLEVGKEPYSMFIDTLEEIKEFADALEYSIDRLFESMGYHVTGK